MGCIEVFAANTSNTERMPNTQKCNMCSNYEQKFILLPLVSLCLCSCFATGSYSLYFQCSILFLTCLAVPPPKDQHRPLPLRNVIRQFKGLVVIHPRKDCVSNYRGAILGDDKLTGAGEIPAKQCLNSLKNFSNPSKRACQKRTLRVTSHGTPPRWGLPACSPSSSCR